MSENTSAPAPLLKPEIKLSSAEEQLQRILDHIRGYHLALDMREHNAGAAFRALLGIQEVLGVEYVQGAEETRQRTGK